MIEIPIFHIDAFTAKPFKGNPAAVCLLDKPRTAEWMQAVAAEMNLSETAYLVPRAGGGYDLRWFTPAIEVPLCGHATLASAHALWESGSLAEDQEARFHTLSGWLTARKQGQNIELDFPAIFSEEIELPEMIGDALGLKSTRLVSRRALQKHRGTYLLELESYDSVINLNPDFKALHFSCDTGVIVTARGTTKYDFVSRFFAPFAGIDEDPVTGIAHCQLTPYWSEKLGKIEMFAYQASKRGGEVKLRLNGDRVALGGQAITIVRGKIIVT
jgi:PhzF family phenazine biosynthesis protein